MVVQNRFSPIHERLTAQRPVASKIGESRLLRFPWNVLTYCAVRCMSLEERPDHVRVVERWLDTNQFGKVPHSAQSLDARKPFEPASSLISARREALRGGQCPR